MTFLINYRTGRYGLDLSQKYRAGHHKAGYRKTENHKAGRNRAGLDNYRAGLYTTESDITELDTSELDSMGQEHHHTQSWTLQTKLDFRTGHLQSCVGRTGTFVCVL